MPFAVLLALAAIAGATLLTYLYDRDALIWSRLCAGVCVGFAALGLVGFVLASWVGLTPSALALAGLVCASPLLLLADAGRRARVGANVRESVRAVFNPGREQKGQVVPALCFHFAASLLFAAVFASAMYQTRDGIFTGVDTNIGDLPFHLSVITGFAYGENFPPEHPEFAGVRLTYPFIVDFVTAAFVRAGAGLEGALFWQNLVMMMAVVGLLHRWALKLTRAQSAALVAAALVLLSGGFGWWTFLGEVWSGGGGFVETLAAPPHDYTIMGHINYRWGNAVTVLFVTQRGIVLGLGLALVAWTLWWDASRRPGVGGRESGAGSQEPSAAAADVESRGVGAKKKFKGKGKAARVREADAGSAWGASSQDVGDAGGASADRGFDFCLRPFALREMIAAGLVAGLLPLVHAHSFVVMMLMGACFALMQGVAVLAGGRGEGGGGDGSGDAARAGGDAARAGVWEVWRPWVAFAVAASVLALPQMFWATRDSAARAGQFFGWELGWDHGTEKNVPWFWIKNTAVFFPLLFAAFALWARGRGRVGQSAAGRGRREPGRVEGGLVSDRLIFFYLPFVLCFVVPNVCKLSPWVWDNIKVLFYWWVASAPLVALVLVGLWRRGGVWPALALALLLAQTAAGGLDVWRAASGTVERREFDAAGVAFAEVVRRETAPRSLILHAPTYNDPVYLTGRRSFLGYPGHVWSHGIDYAGREAALKQIYSGSPEAHALVERERIEYVVVGPLEREEMTRYGLKLNESFFNRYRKVWEAGGYRLYKTRP